MCFIIKATTCTKNIEKNKENVILNYNLNQNKIPSNQNQNNIQLTPEQREG